MIYRMQLDIQTALENIYISPLEQCNLNCRLCYTHKTKNKLSNKKILDFIEKYRQKVNLKSVLFCGGEVFTLPDFPKLVNKLSHSCHPESARRLGGRGEGSQREGKTGRDSSGDKPPQNDLFITVITNGTIDRLEEIEEPSNCQLLVSLDGPKEIHDQNRGSGNFDKSVTFIKKALKLGFPVEVMFLITPQSYPYRNTLPQLVNSLTPQPVNFNYITQKTFFYTNNHPLSNQKNQKSALTKEQIIDIKKNYPSIPGKNFGCFQLSIQSNGLIYGCCESPTPLASISDPVEVTIENFKKSLEPCKQCHSELVSESLCSGCCNPDFLCGYIQELGGKNCKEVVELLHEF